MNYQQIKEQAGSTVIKNIIGRVVKVWPPSRPSEAQARAGIFPQGIVLQNDRGDELSLKFMKKEQHLGDEAMGKIFHFQSVATDGKLDGLVVSRWNDRQSGDSKMNVQVNKNAHYYEVQDNGEQPEAQAAEVSPVIKRLQEAAKQVSIGGLVSVYSHILREFELQLDGTKVLEAMLKEPKSLTSAAGCVFIEACRNGLQRQSSVVTQNITDAPPEPVKNELESVADIAKYIVNSENFDNGVLEAFRIKLGVSYGAIWDEAYKLIPPKYSDNSVTAAWDSFDASIIKESEGKAPSSELICQEICNSWPEFLLALETAEKFNAKAA